MRQFDVCRLRDGPLVVIMQHDYLDELRSRLVAPLMFDVHWPAIDKIHVAVDFDGRKGLVAMDQLTAVQRSALGRAEGSLAEYEYKLKIAIDCLFIGY
jgi:uncharacterized protein YhdP